jgi:hypothetical protein
MEKTWKKLLGSRWDKLLKLKRESTDPYVKDFRCPECNTLDTDHVIGWCDYSILL